MRRYLLILVVLFISGCAVGNKYSYRTSSVALPIKPSAKDALVLLVKDLRPYVLDGKKSPDFVGLQRGGFGNPFDVTTTSGKPMTEEMSLSVAHGLTDAGYRVIEAHGQQDMAVLVNRAESEGATRILVLQVREWKSDIYMSVTLHCDMTLNVHDTRGALLAASSAEFVKPIGGAQMGADKNSRVVAKEFAKQIGYLFNDEAVRGALD